MKRKPKKPRKRPNVGSRANSTKRKPTTRKSRKRRWNKPKKQRLAEAKNRRKIREETAPGRGVTMEDRKKVYDYYGRQCLKCGSTKKLCLDHVHPLFMGGRHDPDNLQVLCWPCNKDKGIKTADYRPKPWFG